MTPPDVPSDKRIHDLESLVDVAKELGRTLDLDDLLARIMRLSEEVMEAEAASLLLLSEDGRELVFQVARGEAGDHIKEGFRVQLGQGIAGHCASTGEPVLVPDAYADERFDPSFDESSGFTTRCILAVPLTTRDKLVGVAQVFNKSDGRVFDDYDAELFDGFAGMAAVAIDNAQGHQHRLERDRLQRALAHGREIQQSFLPHHFPDVDGYRFEALSEPALEVAGDLFDWFPVGDERIGLTIGDVSGKGVSAALYMARLMSDMRFEAGRHDEAAETLREVNRILSERTARGLFVTLLMFDLDPQADRLRVVNAGHPPALRVRPDGTVTMLDGFGEPPMGILPDVEFQEVEAELEAGDWLISYTDGVTEARSTDGDMYGTQRLIEVVGRAVRRGDSLVESIRSSVEDFSAGAPRADDLTLLCIHRTTDN